MGHSHGTRACAVLGEDALPYEKSVHVQYWGWSTAMGKELECAVSGEDALPWEKSLNVQYQGRMHCHG